MSRILTCCFKAPFCPIANACVPFVGIRTIEVIKINFVTGVDMQLQLLHQVDMPGRLADFGSQTQPLPQFDEKGSF